MCKGCKLGDPNYCLDCSYEGYYLSYGNCQTFCKEGEYKNMTISEGKRVCSACQDDCLQCQSKESCQICKPPLLNFNGGCVATCPNNFEPNIYKTQCQQLSCSRECEECSSAGYCLKCKPYLDSSDKLLVLAPNGKCVLCIAINGLQYEKEKCREICGDKFLYKLPLSENSCDDDNDKNGDGCSSDCQIEKYYTCSREHVLDQSNFKNKDKCRRKFEVNFFRNSNNYKELQMVLRFKSKSDPKTDLINLGDLAPHYQLFYTQKEDKNLVELSSTFKLNSKHIASFNVDVSPFEGKLDGYIELSLKKKSEFLFFDDK